LAQAFLAEFGVPVAMGSPWHYSIAIASSCAAAIAVLNTGILAWQHAKKSRHVALRTYTLRILLMVPVYTISSLVALLSPIGSLGAEAMKIFRHLYESVVIFSFLQFILVCVGGPEAFLAQQFLAEEEAARDLELLSMEGASQDQRPAPLRHIPGLNRIMPAWRSRRQMLRGCVTGILMYPFLGILTGMVLLAVYIFKWTGVHPPFAASVTLAVCKYIFTTASGLAVFFLAELAVNMHQELKDLRPKAKFLSVKFVVFATFWQALLLQGLGSAGLLDGLILDEQPWKTQADVVMSLQSLLVCFEMLLASILHYYVFPPQDSLTVLAKLAVGGHDISPGKDHRLYVVNFGDIMSTALLVNRLTMHRSKSALPSPELPERRSDVENQT